MESQNHSETTNLQPMEKEAVPYKMEGLLTYI